MWGSTSALVSWGGVARRHPLELDAPLAVAFEVQKGDRRVAVLLPGGVTMVAGAERTPAGDVSRQQLFGSPGFASAVLLKLPIGIVQKPAYLIPYHKFFFGTIEPGAARAVPRLHRLDNGRARDVPWE